MLNILKVGSKKMKLQNIAMAVHQFCNCNSIVVSCKWIPRADNSIADRLSLLSDCDDWSIKQVVFDYFDNRWGPHTCDRFASSYNNKCKIFNSKYLCAGTCGVDALEQVWVDHVNWVAPPPRLIPEVIRKIETEKCRCTMVCPEWRSAPFWAMLIEKDGMFKSYVKNYSCLANDVVICQGRGNNGMFAKRELSFNMIFFKIEFFIICDFIRRIRTTE